MLLLKVVKPVVKAEEPTKVAPEEEKPALKGRGPSENRPLYLFS